MRKLFQLAAALPLMLLLAGCASTEPDTVGSWDYYGWDINAPTFSPVTNHIYRP